MLRPCPTCRRDTQWEDNPWRPFCSERCKLIDLGAWSDESYRVPSGQDGDETWSEPTAQPTGPGDRFC